MARWRGRWLILGLLVAGLAAAGAAIVLPRAADPEDVYERALGEVEAGRFERAETSLARLGRLRSPTALDWGLRARVAIARHRTDSALDALQHIPETHALGGWAHLRMGQLALRQHQFRVAEAHLRKALKRDARLIEARRELIYLLGVQLRRRELHEQFQALATQTRLKPHEAWTWSLVRDLAWWEPSEQIPILRQALEADAEDRWSRLALAENLRRLGDYAQAESVLSVLRASDPDARAARAELALERKDPEAAEALLAEGPCAHPGLATLRGRQALARGNAEAALRAFERALAAEPDRRETLAHLGRAWLVAGHPEKAQPYLDAAAHVDALNNLLLRAEPRISQRDPDLCLRLGAACEAAHRLPEARAWYGLAAAADPFNAQAQQSLARLRQN